VSAGTGPSLLLLLRLPAVSSVDPVVGGVGLALDSALCLPLLRDSLPGGGLATVAPVVVLASPLPMSDA
jgi:hypothetical protein